MLVDLGEVLVVKCGGVCHGEHGGRLSNHEVGHGGGEGGSLGADVVEVGGAFPAPVEHDVGVGGVV